MKLFKKKKKILNVLLRHKFLEDVRKYENKFFNFKNIS